MRECTCRECGKTFPGGPRAWFCPKCRADRRREASRVGKVKERAGLTRQLGSADQCPVCGQDYIVNSGNQRYCPNCAPDAIRANDAAQGLAYYHANADKINPRRNLARRKRKDVK